MVLYFIYFKKYWPQKRQLAEAEVAEVEAG